MAIVYNFFVHQLLGHIMKDLYICSKIKTTIMEDKRSIGLLIKEEVGKQKLSVTEFANRIHCVRGNVYDIYKRDSIDIIQLKLICKVLNRNFFKELAENMDLINSTSDYSKEEEHRRKVVSHFFEIVPDILESMGKSTSIIFEKDDALPDFAISSYNITFTILDSLESRLPNPCLKFSRCKRNDVEICINDIKGTISFNIIINDKTEDEWRETLKFVFENYPGIEEWNN